MEKNKEEKDSHYTLPQQYSEILMNHFLQPRNTGEVSQPDGIGLVGDPRCGDYLKITIRIENNVITDIKFLCRGCPASIGTASVMTELVKGKHIDEAEKVTEEVLLDAVNGLPEGKRHCSVLAATGLYQAIADWLFSSIEEEAGKAIERI